MKKIALLLVLALFLQGCFGGKEEEIYSKGFQVNSVSEDEQGNKVIGLPIDSLSFEMRPVEILHTYSSQYRLTPLFKVNYDKKGNSFVGELDFHFSYQNDDELYDFIYDKDGNYIKKRKSNIKNDWNGHFMPGFGAVYGYNIVNVSVFNTETKTQKLFFKKPTLIKTIYFPAIETDTLNYKPIKRDFYMISAYDEDTNKDGYITIEDLRRFYYFNLDLTKNIALLPKEYSVISSEYDSDNDYMYVFARYDKNKNGKIDTNEPTHIHWIDLKNPENRGVFYGN